MQYSAQRQSGSAIVYVIVGVLLTVVAIGAIIVAQNRGGEQIATRPITEAPQAQGGDAESNPPKQTEEEKQQQAQKEAADKKAAEDKAAADAAAKKQAEDKKAAETTAQQQAAAAASPMARTGGAVAQSANNLPTTGPVEDTLSMVTGLTAILGAGYFYYHFGRRG